MISVEDAEAVIQAQVRDFGKESVPFEQALGRVLAEDLKADRDLPPYNRVAMDGVAISYHAFEKGLHTFQIRATQAAGEAPVDIQTEEECIEIMTGAVLPPSTDTVIRYEDLSIGEGTATVLVEQVKKGQNIHRQGKDKQQGDVVAQANQLVTPALISMAASVGATVLPVKKLPKVAVISTGDELVEVGTTPLPFQIRRSNSYTVKAALQKYSVQADLLHLPDNMEATQAQLKECLQRYDALLLSGGVSMGKFDYVPRALEGLGVEKLFHKVQQKPGKPFWFGIHPEGALVFALPGNPVSTFMCLHRYFVPWLEASLGVGDKPQLHAVLHADTTFMAPLQYFLQVALSVNDRGQLLATPLEGNGSGDFANLVAADAFLELPANQQEFKAGEVYRVWPFKPLY
ncbi:molybdopterin molybdochelatase [Pontibacter ummariensis]|uniref:Molybdopterin molybdenumtransferase n=1 Tax=Pontibacter ummariensis TaxID=1610492 RepID=A0A239I7D0_9BACT|nr:molybdopterin molybdotransferase MoeA [Pontibacter ummariensis]PRY10214.1 molybdopterin molybdochelatase [Pontibacter ummariensis]SNS88234.1 molybdopterin molybdochelatase [Pontibacter ummariensis]